MALSPRKTPFFPREKPVVPRESDFSRLKMSIFQSSGLKKIAFPVEKVNMKSFTEVLFEQFEKQLGQKAQAHSHSKNQSFQSEIVDTDPSCLSQILGRTQPFKSSGLKNTYPRPTPKPRLAHRLDEEQKQALCFLRKLGASLEDNFAKSELKSIFRKMMKQLHPDIPGGSEELFKEAFKSFKALERLFVG